MYSSKKILGIIPARGGSKGIKLKNLQEINGVSLIKHVAKVVHQVGDIDHTVVSTDHYLIKKEAEESGLDVPFMRPFELSLDYVADLPVLKHALEKSQIYYQTDFDYVLMLQPTSPTRNSQHIIMCLDKIIKGDYDSVWTVSEVNLKYHPEKQLLLENDQLTYSHPNGKNIIARQMLTKTYYRNGLCYAFNAKKLSSANNLLMPNSSAVVTHDFSISIDTLDDLNRVEEYLSNQNL
jgi:CMP-N-acetylneuraminic acid synthetase